MDENDSDDEIEILNECTAESSDNAREDSSNDICGNSEQSTPPPGVTLKFNKRSGNNTEADTSDENPEPSTPLSTAMIKRSFSQRTPTQSPIASPKKKKERRTADSSIRTALALADETGGQRGLLKFFSKGTKEDVASYWHREEERREEETSVTLQLSRSIEMERISHRRELARQRQQKRREILRSKEVHEGKRSPRVRQFSVESQC